MADGEMPAKPQRPLRELEPGRRGEQPSHRCYDVVCVLARVPRPR
jgi:hypothetical protein